MRYGKTGHTSPYISRFIRPLGGFIGYFRFLQRNRAKWKRVAFLWVTLTLISGLFCFYLSLVGNPTYLPSVGLTLKIKGYKAK